jgi:transcriptional regulator with XRE-family HTH domain
MQEHELGPYPMLYTVQELREQHDLTKLQLAHVAGMTPATLLHWERSGNNLSRHHREALARLFSSSVDEIVDTPEIAGARMNAATMAHRLL